MMSFTRIGAEIDSETSGMPVGVNGHDATQAVATGGMRCQQLRSWIEGDSTTDQSTIHADRNIR